MAAGEMRPDEFTSFLDTVFAHLVAHSADGSIHDLCIDWRHLFEMLSAGKASYSQLLNVCVWAKSHFGYRSEQTLKDRTASARTGKIAAISSDFHQERRAGVLLIESSRFPITKYIDQFHSARCRRAGRNVAPNGLVAI
jgi:hypothetical protein